MLSLVLIHSRQMHIKKEEGKMFRILVVAIQMHAHTICDFLCYVDERRHIRIQSHAR